MIIGPLLCQEAHQGEKNNQILNVRKSGFELRGETKQEARAILFANWRKNNAGSTTLDRVFSGHSRNISCARQ
jgi:hypothetical protein